jgi:hypothetical protein
LSFQIRAPVDVVYQSYRLISLLILVLGCLMDRKGELRGLSEFLKDIELFI